MSGIHIVKLATAVPIPKTVIINEPNIIIRKIKYNKSER
jgi:hypothetical protein